MGIAGLCPGTVMPPVIAALMMTFSTFHPFRRASSPRMNVKDRIEPPQTRVVVALARARHPCSQRYTLPPRGEAFVALEPERSTSHG
jgi:hypothetical protein